VRLVTGCASSLRFRGGERDVAASMRRSHALRRLAGSQSCRELVAHGGILLRLLSDLFGVRCSLLLHRTALPLHEVPRYASKSCES
jgi:broad specificity phosphatase PhoE